VAAASTPDAAFRAPATGTAAPFDPFDVDACPLACDIVSTSTLLRFVAGSSWETWSWL